VTVRRTIAAAGLAGLSLLGGCTVYQTAPGVYAPAPPSPPSAFDRSWNAALGAFQDQGLAISSADRSTGTIRGHRGGTELAANLRTQADGSVRVQFNSVGGNAQDPQLIDRVSRSFDVRMGR
jgi:hypothetical protein